MHEKDYLIYFSWNGTLAPVTHILPVIGIADRITINWVGIVWMELTVIATVL